MSTGSEGSITRLVAWREFGGLGDGVVVSTPHEFDGVSNRCVQGEGNVTEDTLCWGDNDGPGCAGSSASLTFGSGSRRRVRRSGATELCDTFY